MSEGDARPRCWNGGVVCGKKTGEDREENSIVTLLDPPLLPLSGVVERALMLIAALLLATEEESAILFLG